jgi:hypothetical protein
MTPSELGQIAVRQMFKQAQLPTTTYPATTPAVTTPAVTTPAVTTPASTILAQKGGYLSNLFGKSYGAGGNYGNMWETPIGKGLLPMVAKMPDPFGVGIMAAGMGPSDWKTLMSKSTPGSARLGGFSRSSLNKFDESQNATPLAKYGAFLYKFGQELPENPNPLGTFGSTSHPPVQEKMIDPRITLDRVAANREALQPQAVQAPKRVLPDYKPGQLFHRRGEDVTDTNVNVRGIEINPDEVANYYKPDEGMQREVDDYLRRTPLTGGFQPQEHHGQYMTDADGYLRQLEIPGGSGGGQYLDGQGRVTETIPLHDISHPVTNQMFFELSNQMRDAGIVESKGKLLGRFAGAGGIQQIPTEADLARYLAGYAEPGGRPAFNEQGLLQRGNSQQDVYNRKGQLTRQGQRQAWELDVPAPLSDSPGPDLHWGTADDVSGSREITGMDPNVVAQLRAREIYPHYKKWLEAQKTPGSAFQTVTGIGRQPGSQATHRPFDVYGDDLPSLLLGGIASGLSTGNWSLAGEQEAYYGSQRGHQLMSMWNNSLRGLPGHPDYDPSRPLQPWEQVVNERAPEGFKQKFLEYGILDPMALPKNWANYEMGMYMKGIDPRWYMRQGITSVPRTLGAIRSPIKTFQSLKSMPAAVRTAYATYKASLPAGQVAKGPAAWAALKGLSAANPLGSVFRGMGYGPAPGYVPGSAGSVANSLIPKVLPKAPVQGIGGWRTALKNNWNVLKGKPLPKGTNLLPRLPKLLRGSGAPSRLGQGMKIGGRALGALEGLRVLFQEPLEEYLEILKGRTGEEIHQNLKKRSQGRWGEMYRRAAGFIPKQQPWLDDNQDGEWDRDDAGNLIPNPNAGKSMIGFKGFGGQTEMPSWLNKGLQQVMMGVEQPQYAAQELGASGLDALGWAANKLGIAENPQWGRLLSDPTRDVRFGINLSDTELSDFYQEGTHENLSARLPGMENALKERLNEINPETAVRNEQGEIIGGFHEPSAEVLENEMGHQQLIKYVMEQHPEDLPTAAHAREFVATIPIDDRREAIEYIKNSYTPDGRMAVEDFEVKHRQISGYVLKKYGNWTRPSVVRNVVETDDGFASIVETDDEYKKRVDNAPAYLSEYKKPDGTWSIDVDLKDPYYKYADHREIPLKDLPNDTENPDGSKHWSAIELSNGVRTWNVGMRDYHVEQQRRRVNHTMRNQVMETAQKFYAEREVTQDQAIQLALGQHGEHLTISSRIKAREEANPEAWAEEHPKLTLAALRESMQAKITELSPYRPQVMRQDMLAGYETGKREDLKRLRHETETLPGMIESKRDVTAGVEYNEDTYQQTQQQRSTAVARMHELNDSRPEGGGEELIEWRREFNHNKGIVQAVDGFHEAYKNMRFMPFTGGTAPLYGDTAAGKQNRKDMAGSGPAIHRYENYNPKDKTRDIVQTINRNKGRRAMWDALSKAQQARYAAARLHSEQEMERRRQLPDWRGKNLDPYQELSGGLQ